MSRDNMYQHLNNVWVILNDWRKDNPEKGGNDPVDIAWVAACQAMDWIQEDLEAAYHGAADPRPYEER